MATPIDTDTLREWLDDHRPVTVLDVRSDADREQWAIPGSVHVNAYEALKIGEPGPLATIPLPAGQPVVTVCGAGRASVTAAEMLAARLRHWRCRRHSLGTRQATSQGWRLRTRRGRGRRPEHRSRDRRQGPTDAIRWARRVLH